MANGIYVGVDGVARKVKQPYVGVSGVARKITNGYIGVDGIARKFYSGAAQIGELGVGTLVYVNVDETPMEFIVVHQGLPDATLYDSSCDGTWLLSRDILTSPVSYGSYYCVYAESNPHSFCNEVFPALLDSGIQNVIKTVKIPYSTSGTASSAKTGSNGLSTTAFILSYAEVGFGDSDYANKEGAALDYFSSNLTRIAYYNGTATSWFLRTPQKGYNDSIWTVTTYGSSSRSNTTSTEHGERPAFILPREILVDSNFNIIT